MENDTMNILTFTKTITNPTKLVRDIKASTSFGSLYSFLSIKGTELNIHFTQNLNQSQIDACSVLVANYSDISVFDNLYGYLGKNIDPFVDEFLRTLRAENMELGITQLGKTADVLGFFEMPVLLPGKTRAVSFKGSLDTGSLTVTMELATYLAANPSLYSDLSPFITAERLISWKIKIYTHLTTQ
jgi:hypothetical protein